MKKRHVICISGWAHHRRPFLSLEQSLGPEVSFTVHAPHQLLLSGSARLSAVSGESSPYARELEAELIALDAPFVLVGWSMGGIIALETLLAGRVFPDKLVLLATTPRFIAAADFLAGNDERNLRAMIYQFRKDPRPTVSQFMELIGVSKEEQQARLDEIAEVPTECLLDGLYYLLEADLRRNLGKLSVPTLICQGAADAVISSQASQFLHDQLVASELHVSQMFGHDLLQQTNREMVQKVSEFIVR